MVGQRQRLRGDCNSHREGYVQTHRHRSIQYEIADCTESDQLMPRDYQPFQCPTLPSDFYCYIIISLQIIR